MLCESQAVKSWPLEKYAKFVATNETQSTYKQGNWKQFSSPSDGSSCLQVSLFSSNNMVVSDGKVIHESFSLFNAKKWLQAIVKGDSMLIIYKMNNDSRRFRIKFGKISDRSAVENCRQFVSEISSQISVREITAGTCAESDSQAQMEDSQFISPESQHVPVSKDAGSTTVSSPAVGSEERGLTLSDLANKISSSESISDVTQPTGRMGVPQDRLSLLVRLCLTDSNFPAFVEAVGKELHNLTSSND